MVASLNCAVPAARARRVPEASLHNLSAVVLAWQQDLTTALPGSGSVIDLVTQTGVGQSGRPRPAAPVLRSSRGRSSSRSPGPTGWPSATPGRSCRSSAAARSSQRCRPPARRCPTARSSASSRRATPRSPRSCAGRRRRPRPARPLLKSLAAVDRALLRASAVEVNKLEKKVTFLATIASAAPFIGLFGTVWGIMDAFRQIGGTGSTNLSVIGPGISAGAHRHRGGTLRRDPGGLLLQPLHDQDQGAGVGNR